jgi:ankyrin repeat protein
MIKAIELKEDIHKFGKLLLEQDEDISNIRRQVVLGFYNLSQKKQFLDYIENDVIEVKVFISSMESETYPYPLKNFLALAIMDYETSNVYIKEQVQSLYLLLDPKVIDEELVLGHSTPLEKAVSQISLPIVKFLIEEKYAEPAKVFHIIMDHISRKFRILAKLNLEEVELQKIANDYQCYNYILQKINLFNLEVEDAAEIIVTLSKAIEQHQQYIRDTEEHREHMSIECLEKLIKCLEGSQDYLEGQLYNASSNEEDLDEVKSIYKAIIHKYDPRSSIFVKELNYLDLSQKLHMAIILRNVRKCQQYISENVTLIHSPDEARNISLHYATMFGDIKILKLFDNLQGLDHPGSQRKTSLMYACQSGAFEIVKIFFERGSNINAEDIYGKTPLMYACGSGNFEIVKYLIENKADIDVINKYAETPLMYACEAGNFQIVELLIAQGADVNAKDRNGKTVLMYACEAGNFEIVELLIAQGAGVNVEDYFEKTVLMYACAVGSFELVELLIAQGADVNAVDSSGKTLLMDVYALGGFEIVELLVQRADVNVADHSRKTILMHACEVKSFELVELLIAEEVNVNAADNSGKTALMYACEAGNFKIVELLIAQGADVNAEINNGKTVLMYACAIRSYEIVELLIAQGANVNAKDHFKKTALMVACEFGGLKVVKLLVEQIKARSNNNQISVQGSIISSIITVMKRILVKTALEVLDNRSRTPLMYACKGRDFETVIFLIAQGADVNVADHNGKTVLMYACEVGSFELVKLLIAQGANVSAADYLRKTVLMYACGAGIFQTIELLIAQRVDINLADSGGKTALMYACECGKGEKGVINLLIQSGADIGARDLYQQGILAYTSNTENLAIVELIIAQGAKVNVADYHNRTPVMYAQGAIKSRATFR